MHFSDWLTVGVAAILVGLLMYGRVAIWKKYTDRKARELEPGDPM
ncbi:MAG: hypothetical protein AAF557_02790 [Pseudomonadota bacterium]